MKWKTVKISDVADICLGKMLDQEKNQGNYMPYLANINVRWGEFDLSNIRKMRFESDELEKFSLKYGDIIMCEGGEPGRCAIWKQHNSNILFQKALHRIRTHECLDSNYLYYVLLLMGKHNSFDPFLTGSTIKHLPSIKLAIIDIPLPPLLIQRKIAAVLTALDDKIALNRRINDKLEAMAKRLYDYWFVQFDFPDENGRPYKSSGGKMVWNEALKREIPAGWEVKRLGDIENKIITGKTPSTSVVDYFGGNIPFITIDDIRKGKFVVISERTLTEKGANSQLGKYLSPFSLCCSCIGTIGLIGFTSIISQTNQQINSIVFQDKTNLEFLYFALKHYFNNASIKTGNIFSNMNKEEFSSITIIYPKNCLLSLFHNKLASFFNNQLYLEKQSAHLTSLRDRLLPLLMNGQVEVY